MRTVLHLTSDDEGDLQHAMRAASLLFEHADLPHEGVTVLAHRRAARLAAASSPLAAEIEELMAKGITVAVGATCFDALGLPREAVPGVDVVPSGVSELVRLQSAGYNYVKIP